MSTHSTVIAGELGVVVHWTDYPAGCSCLTPADIQQGTAVLADRAVVVHATTCTVEAMDKARNVHTFTPGPGVHRIDSNLYLIPVP